MVGGDDFTIRGGAADASIGGKQVYAEKMARELRVPIVRLVDGTGGVGSVRSLDTIGRTYVPANPGWNGIVQMLSEVPVVSAAMGSVAGLGAARVVTSHWSIMVKDSSQVFVAGPPVVAYGMGEEVAKEDLGGAEIHYHNGVCDNLAENEEDAFRQIRQFLSYLPQNAWQQPQRSEPNDDPKRREEWLLSAIPRSRRRPHKVREILEAILDRDSWFEIGGGWGRSLVTRFGRLDGYPVAVISMDPYFYGGGLTADGSEKMARFVDLCDTFHLPVVNFLDQPGFVIGTAGERAATIRKGASAMAASVPGDGAVGDDHPAAGVRCGRGGAREYRRPQPALCMAERRLGQPPARRRDRGGIPPGPGELAGPGCSARGDRGADERGAVAVPDG